MEACTWMDPDDVDRIVLLLAHDGVSQPELWRRWEAGGGARVVVHCPERAACCAFVRDRRLDIPYGQTSWGHPSIVRETLKAFAALLEALKNADADAWDGGEIVPKKALVFLASGTCVPVRPAASMLDMPYASVISKAKLNATAVPQSKQWACLTREDVERVVTYYASADGVFDASSPNFDAMVMTCYSPKQWACADNIFLHHVLGFSESDATTTKDCSLTMQGVWQRMIVSPIEWRALDVPVASTSLYWAFEELPIGASRLTTSGRMTLRQYMLGCRLECSVFFARKVMPTVAFDEDTYAMLLAPRTEAELIAELCRLPADFLVEEISISIAERDALERIELAKPHRRIPHPLRKAWFTHRLTNAHILRLFKDKDYDDGVVGDPPAWFRAYFGITTVAPMKIQHAAVHALVFGIVHRRSLCAVGVAFCAGVAVGRVITSRV